MNFLAHAEVARRVGGDDPAFVWGAVLPDLAPMLGLQVDRGELAPRVLDGWRAHHHMDEVFHAHPTFLAGVRTLHAELDVLARGPRRAVAHVGWELLLDEAVDGDAFLRLALAAAPAELAERFRTSARPPVAERAWRAVSRRPRLAFDHDDLPQVAAVLDAHARAVAAEAPSVLSDVLVAMRAPEGP